jgi:hypothetical protein
METPAMHFECTCKIRRPFTESEKRIAERMGLPVEWLHNLLDNWEDAFDETYPL